MQDLTSLLTSGRSFKSFRTSSKATICAHCNCDIPLNNKQKTVSMTHLAEHIVQYFGSSTIPAKLLMVCMHIDPASVRMTLTCLDKKLLILASSLPRSLQQAFLHDVNVQFVLTNSSSTDIVVSTSNKAARHKIKIRSVLSCVPLSCSTEWSDQRNFYLTSGLAAWKRVPSHISNNPLVAKIYSQLIHLSDSLLVLEVAAGQGILSYMLACELKQSNQYRRLKVICTDFHTNVFTSLSMLPWFKRLVEEGILEFQELAVIGNSETVATKYTSDEYGIVAVVANYAVDSFPVDVVIFTPSAIMQLGTVTADSGRYCVRKLCPSCCLPYHDDCTESAATPTAVLYRRVLEVAGHGVHVIPTALLHLLQTIRINYAASLGYQLLVGDCFAAPDDNDLWHYDDFATLEVHDQPLAVPWFRSPVICGAAFALPVGITGIIEAWKMVFGESTAVTHSPIHMSDFTLLSLNTHATPCAATSSATCMPSFTPNDFMTLRQLVNEDKCFLSTLSLLQLEQYVLLSNHDVEILLDIRWQVAKRVREDADKVICGKRKRSCDEVKLWYDLALECLKRQCCTYWEWFKNNVDGVAQMFLAMRCDEAYKYVLQLYSNDMLQYVYDKHDVLLQLSICADDRTSVLYIHSARAGWYCVIAIKRLGLVCDLRSACESMRVRDDRISDSCIGNNFKEQRRRRRVWHRLQRLIRNRADDHLC